jgi:hypothetical protein
MSPSDDTRHETQSLAARCRDRFSRSRSEPTAKPGAANYSKVEIFFSILYRRLLKLGIFTSEDDLARQRLAFIESYNQKTKPFKRTYVGKVLEA